MKKTGLLLQILLIAAFLAGCSSAETILTINTPNTASAITWAPTGSAIIANGFNEISTNNLGAGAIGVWDTGKKSLTKTLISADDLHDYIYTGQLDVSPDGSLLLISAPYMAGRSMGFVSLYDIAQNTLIESWEGIHLDNDESKAQETIQGAQFSPDGSKFAIAGSFYIRIFDSASRNMIDQFPTNARGGTVNSGDERLETLIAWSPDGTKLAWKILRNLSVYDLASRQEVILKRSQMGSIPTPNAGLDWSFDGSLLVYEKDKALQFIDPGSATLKFSINISGEFEENHVKSVSFSPDGTMVAFCASEYVGVWNIADKTLIFSQKITNPENEIDRYDEVAWSPDSHKLAILSYGVKQILVYNISK
jgi:WD40 repeat protein